ncbi:hypothetical protein VE03_03951 [Pseudogymnoascus sp. 23342-1-I1]|nr:hypothetical protein VE03_03951 [Pseudogymnoascus sp. 23342-1-I1]
MSRTSVKAILIATLLHLSAAQISVEFPVDPDEFTYKGTMCNAQHGICDILCSRAVNVNICDSTTLQFDCKCASNNSAPGLQYYEGSIADYMCRVTASNCMDDNVGNATALETCTSIRSKCGFLDRMEFTAPPTAISLSSTLSTGTPKPTAASTTSSSPKSDSAPASSLATPVNSTPTSEADSADSTSSSEAGLSTGAKAGIGAGAAIGGLLLLGAAGYFFYRAGKRSSVAAAAEAGAAGTGAAGDGTQKDSEKDAVKVSAEAFGPELEDTQRLEIGGREIPGELEAGAAGLQSVAEPVEMGMSERDESEVRRVVGSNNVGGEGAETRTQ